MTELNELLKLISNISWLFYVLAMLMFYYITKKSANTKSSLITIVIAVAINAVMIGYQEILLSYMEANPGYNPVLNFFWYMGYAGFDIIAMLAIYFIHKRENVRIASLGQFIGLSFFAACSLQLAQYSEIILLNTDQHLYNIYMIGIPTLSIAMAIVSFGLAAVAIYHLHFHEKGLRGLKRWTI